MQLTVEKSRVGQHFDAGVVAVGHDGKLPQLPGKKTGTVPPGTLSGHLVLVQLQTGGGREFFGKKKSYIFFGNT